MKAYKKLILIFITAIIILGMVAFYSPVQNVSQPQPEPESQENYSVSLNEVSSTSTASVTEKTSFEDMSGFSDLDQENDLLGEMEGASTGSVDDIFNELK